MKHKQDKHWYDFQVINPFRLDLRSLAFYRVALGFALLYDAVSRWTDLTVHYTDQGVVSAGVAETLLGGSYSLHFLIDGWWWPALLFLIQTLAAISMIVGYRTRLATFISWIILLSVQKRNPYVLNGGDTLIVLHTFWAIFLPLNKRFSLDLAQHRVLSSVAKTAFTPATIAVVVQTALLFMQTSALKTGALWRESNEALYFALSAEQFSAPFGVWMTQYRDLLKMFSWGSLRIEEIIPFLLLNPFYNHISRVLVLVLGTLFYFGIILLMSVGLFPWVGIVTLIPLLPGGVWDSAKRFVEKRVKVAPLKVYYDTDCGICQSFVRLLSVFAVGRKVTVESIYDTKSILERSDKYNSWVAKSGSRHYYRANVLVEILKRSYLWWWFAGVLSLKPANKLANKIYDFVAAKRSRACRPVKEKKFNGLRAFIGGSYTIISGAAVFLFLGIAIAWVWADMPNVNGVRVAGNYRRYAQVLSLTQKWNMFAPTPINSNNWYIVEATTKNGEVIDVWRPYWDKSGSSEFSSEKPDHSYERYLNPRWRRLLTRLQEDGYIRNRHAFLKYMCNDWNTKNLDQEVVSLRLLFNTEVTNLDPQSEVIDQYSHANQECSEE